MTISVNRIWWLTVRYTITWPSRVSPIALDRPGMLACAMGAAAGSTHAVEFAEIVDLAYWRGNFPRIKRGLAADSRPAR